jgi:hypothetical protein
MASALLTRAAPALVSSGISGESGPAFVLVEAVFSGLGIGCASVASTATGASVLREVAQVLASGLLNSFAQVGTALGLAVLFAVAAAGIDALANREEPTAVALVEVSGGRSSSAPVWPSPPATSPSPWYARRRCPDRKRGAQPEYNGKPR